MKMLSLKLDDNVFDETEKVIKQLNMPRNRYINEALAMYNRYNARKKLRAKLLQESQAVYKNSLDVARDFENFLDENI
jgi:metal-responsive CopG/Arc/MetJ family transcriptional regulator